MAAPARRDAGRTPDGRGCGGGRRWTPSQGGVAGGRCRSWRSRSARAGQLGLRPVTVVVGVAVAGVAHDEIERLHAREVGADLLGRVVPSDGAGGGEGLAV